MNKRARLVMGSQRGLTLVEIIVVLVILALLISFLTGGLFNQGAKAKAQLNVLRMKKVQSSINEFQLRYNSLPQSIQDLVQCPSNVQGEVCVAITDPESLLDAWGTPFTYSTDGKGYVIKSLGADRAAGGSGVDGDAELKGP
jgi:general secretion pathway protein G